MQLETLHPILFWLGAAIFIATMTGNAARSGNWMGLFKFWEKRLVLTPTEFKIRNLAIGLMILGALIRLAAQLL